MMNMMMPNSDGGIGYTTDDRFRKKMASKRVKVRCCCCCYYMKKKELKNIRMYTFSAFA